MLFMKIMLFCRKIFRFIQFFNWINSLTFLMKGFVYSLLLNVVPINSVFSLVGKPFLRAIEYELQGCSELFNVCIEWLFPLPTTEPFVQHFVANWMTKEKYWMNWKNESSNSCLSYNSVLNFCVNFFSTELNLCSEYENRATIGLENQCLVWKY